MKRFIALAILILPGGCESLPARSAVAEEVTTPARQSEAEQRGAAYAQTNCASCHAIGRTGDSPLAEAPHFRTLGQRYPVSDLGEAFAEGIVTGHPAMPQFTMSSRENADLIAYLQSIQTRDDR